MPQAETIEGMAMAYALASLDIEQAPNPGISSRVIMTDAGELATNKIRKAMYERFGVYASIVAINDAKEILQMVIPNDQTSAD